MNTSAIYLDRLHRALQSEGVTLKRHQLLSVAASAFGFRNQNEFSAAAKLGALLPPPARPIGRLTLADGTTLLVLADQLANATYAIEESFVEQVVEEERAERIGITPYGHLAVLAEVAAAALPNLCTSSPAPADPPPTLDLHIAVIDHKHGSETYAALTHEQLYCQLVDYCDQWWKEISDESFETDTAGMSHEDIVRRYFDQNDREYLTTNQVTVPVTPALLAKVGIKGGRTDAREAGWSGTEPTEMLELARSLSEAATADIWYEAGDYRSDDPNDPDRAAETEIERTQKSMLRAADLLTELAGKASADKAALSVEPVAVTRP